MSQKKLQEASLNVSKLTSDFSQGQKTESKMFNNKRTLNIYYGWHYWNRPIDNDRRLLTVSSLDLDILNLWFHHDLQWVTHFISYLKQPMKNTNKTRLPFANRDETIDLNYLGLRMKLLKALYHCR